jgi:hypothetical protein
VAAKPHQPEAKMVLGEIRGLRQSLHVLPKSALGRAVKYKDDNWLDLGRFLGDGHTPLDNNDAARGGCPWAARPIAAARACAEPTCCGILETD